MRIKVEYTGELDSEKHLKIVEASGERSHESVYHLPTKTHRITFKASDAESANKIRDKIANAGIESLTTEVTE